jgi:hypothetical protein
MLGLIYPWGWVHQLPETLPPLLEDIPALEEFLCEQIDFNPDILGLAVIREDGSLIAACEMADNLSYLYRLCAAQVAMDVQLCQETGRGECDGIFMTFGDLYTWFKPVGEVIFLMFRKRVNKI